MDLEDTRERQVLYDCTYMWNLMNKINDVHRYREQTDSCQRGGGWRLGDVSEGVKQKNPHRHSVHVK